MIHASLIAEARRLAEIELIPGNQYNADVLQKIELAKALVSILDAIYVQDCHISGMHDPNHTPHSVCEDQLRELALRVLSISNGVTDWYQMDATKQEKIAEMNKIPRKIYRGEDGGWSWWKYFTENGKGEAREHLHEIESWEKNGCIPRPK